MKKLIQLLLFSVVSSLPVFSQGVKIQTLSTGLLFPVCIQNSGIPGDNRLFVLEKRGRIKIINRLTGAVNTTPFLDIYSRVYPITSVSDERGLLGLAFHPDYANNGYFYVNYVNTLGKTVVARYQVSPFADTAFKYSEQIIMTIFQPYSNHKGGNLMFGPEDGYLYISTGDGGSGGDPGNRAQNVDSLLGKTLRIDINNPSPPYYFSAPGNPFYGSTPGRDEIFDWGLRNPWRCSFDRLRHDLWIADVGQNVYEEIDFRSKCDTVGHNYGWKCYEGNTPYPGANCQPQPNSTFPVFVYSHTLGCSVTGGYVYRGGEEGSLFGKYLFTDYCQGRIWATVPNGTGGWTTTQLTQSTTQINNNYSSFGEDVYGELYLAGVSSGQIYRLRDTACFPTAYIDAPDTVFVCPGNPVPFRATYGTGLSYSWTVALGGGTYGSSGIGTSVMTATLGPGSWATVNVTVSNGTCSAVSNSVVVIAGASFSGVVSNSIYCTYSPSVALTGLPGGGTFSGNGVNGNIFTPGLAGVGTHTLSYKFSEMPSSCNYTASGCAPSETKTVVVAICDGIDEQKMLQDVKIYPNPGQSVFNVEFYSPAQTELNLRVTDALGRNIFNTSIEAATGKQEIPITLSDAAEGLYFLYLQTKGFVSVEKIFVGK